jgi:tRNA U34 5-methylaminomethyl-2-thiouridine-forming methyltransferase MnmC
MALQNYRVIRTCDGCQTLYSLRYGEAMHSASGAYQESLLKHVNASAILSKTKKNLHVLDIGFGIGFNTLALKARRSGGVITTYSSPPQIRSALLEAGFLIGRGPSVGPKREGTLASVCGAISFFSSEELTALRENHRAVPYRDPLLRDSRERILERRLAEIRARKGHPVPR